MKTRYHADRKKPEDLRGRLVVARVKRPVKKAFYAQCKAMGVKPCTKLAEWVTKFSGVGA